MRYREGDLEGTPGRLTSRGAGELTGLGLGRLTDPAHVAGAGVQRRRMSTATVQRMSPTWVWMQAAIIVFVVIGMVIAAIKLWA